VEESVEVLGSEVGAVFPGNRVPLEPELSEERMVPETLENRPVEDRSQIDRSFRSITEPELDPILVDVLGSDNV